MRYVAVYIAEVPDSQPSLKFTPYENPSKPPPESSVTPEIKQQPKGAKSAKEPKDIETKVKGRTHAKTIEVSPPSNKLFSGQAVWGPGGYVRDRARSGSVESSSKSDSSSRSSGSDRQTVVKTKAEVKISAAAFSFFLMSIKFIEKVTRSRTEKLRPYEKIPVRRIVLDSLYICVILNYVKLRTYSGFTTLG